MLQINLKKKKLHIIHKGYALVACVKNCLMHVIKIVPCGMGTQFGHSPAAILEEYYHCITCMLSKVTNRDGAREVGSPSSIVSSYLRRGVLCLMKERYSGVSYNAFESNEFASNDPFQALPHLQSNDPKFRSNGNYSGHPGLNFKLPTDH